MKKLILTSSHEAYRALLAAGFIGLGMLPNVEPLYGVFNSDTLKVPEKYAEYLVYTDEMFF